MQRAYSFILGRFQYSNVVDYKYASLNATTRRSQHSIFNRNIHALKIHHFMILKKELLKRN